MLFKSLPPGAECVIIPKRMSDLKKCARVLKKICHPIDDGFGNPITAIWKSDGSIARIPDNEKVIELT